MTSTMHRAARALAVAALLLSAALVAGCGDDETKVPRLAMPDLVGKSIGDAETQTYDALHTSLIYYDLSPANRASANDWVIVATSPEAGKRTPKFEKVYAWALKKSEYDWFRKNPSMPKLPNGASAAKLLGKGGLLEPVADLVKVRYQPGKAPKKAEADPADTAAFVPDRGLHPDLSAEPVAEFGLRNGLRVAPTRGTVAVGALPPTGALRIGQFLVLLVVEKPPAKPKKPETPDFDVPVIETPDIDTGGGSGGSGGPGGGMLGGGIDIPGCPKQICG
ncbi:hypothetical protein ABIE44_002039 [Marmoricola sp. OAE513]|uniref:hypothetical protein n=1 Tax=Marmoricola sp. OAE513 TaxID=2817894 RepID=UPI001AE362FA